MYNRRFEVHKFSAAAATTAPHLHVTGGKPIWQVLYIFFPFPIYAVNYNRTQLVDSKDQSNTNISGMLITTAHGNDSF